MLLLPQEELNDSIKSAIIYSVANRYQHYSVFICNLSYIAFPMPITYREVEEEDSDGEWITDKYPNTIIPISSRRIDRSQLHKGKGKEAYAGIIETLSANRNEIDFSELYNTYKPVIHALVSKETYDTQYAVMVDQLLIAYADLEQDKTKYGVVTALMDEHWQTKLRDGGYSELDDVFSRYKKYIEPDVLAKLEANYKPNETPYFNQVLTMWAYSFWLRRTQEGKTEEIYTVLSAIHSDYSQM